MKTVTAATITAVFLDPYNNAAGMATTKMYPVFAPRRSVAEETIKAWGVRLGKEMCENRHLLCLRVAA